MPASVLLVDDDPAFRRLARRMLTAAGLDVVGEADTVATAIAAARELRPDSALVDVGLPDGDGMTLAGELTALPSPPRVILTSTDAGCGRPGRRVALRRGRRSCPRPTCRASRSSDLLARE